MSLPFRRAFCLALSLAALASCDRSSTTQAPVPSSAPAPGPLAASNPGPSAALAPSAPAPRMPAKPELVSFKSGPLTLAGFLWRPSGAGPFPAIVFNHGSEEYPGAKDGQAELFVPHGFVLFVPHRRGQGRSKDAGRYINDFYDPKAPSSTAFVDALVAQNDDVMAAVAFARSLPFVDPARVAVSGCSLGGIESLLAAERGTGIYAAVDFAGASFTWSTNVPLRERMKAAARDAKVPVFFLQAENDFDTAPSRVLSDLMKAAGKPVRVRIFPPNGKTPEEGHAFCGGGESPPWGDEVLAFLREAMERR